MRLPNGACSTSCMPPDSSKNRSSTSVSCVGMAPSARRPSARYASSCSAASGASAGLRQRATRLPARRHRPTGRSSSRASIIAREVADRARELVAPRRRLAEPERNGRRRALRIRHADGAARDLQDPPGRVAELKDVAGRALDREVLVQRADERLVGIEHDAIVGDFGDGAARRLREQPRRRGVRGPWRGPRRDGAAPRGGRGGWRSPRPPCRRPRRSPSRDEIAVRPGAAHQREELGFGGRPGVAARATPRRSAAPARRAARRAGRWRRARRGGPIGAAPRTRSGRRARPGTRGPSACPATVWPERPTRCSSVAMRCGDPIWQTRSTWPMSMPSSSDAVATSARSCPVFSRVSASSRFSFERLP